ncbi:MAG: Rieske 2Fe-2S domain-containing protein [Pseudomonadales bacterium]|nr:Rieske 2Fe-2S domain-containing protein [Pseudomonadales bacterium]
MAAEKYVRPQKHNSWFNVMPERDFKNLPSAKVDFLDSFVTLEADGKGSYNVRYEGKTPLLVEKHFGFICVWFGDNLQQADWPFPTLFEESFGQDFIISQPKIFKDTNLLDLIENNGDPIHFKTVHKWLEVNLSDHIYTDTKYSLKMQGKVKYAQSSESRLKNWLAKIMPATEYSQVLAFHGPGFGSGNIVTEPDIKAQLILAFMPIGENDLRLHIAASVDEKSFPKWMQTLFSFIPFVSLHDLVSWALTKAGKDDTEGDYRIWYTKRSLKDPKLLKGENNIIKIREWMSAFYLKDFKQPLQTEKPELEKDWAFLAVTGDVDKGKVNRFTVKGEELIAIQTSSGDYSVFEAHCPHQGAHLGHGGVLKDDCISCPFHKFYFNSEGQFIGTKTDGKPKDNMSLTKVAHQLVENRLEVLV